MNFKQFIAIFLAPFILLAGWSFGTKNISFWLAMLIAFAVGVIDYLLLVEEPFKRVKKEEKK
jgi:hypothetical protein